MQMKKVFIAASLALVFAAGFALAADSPFSGTWKVNLASAKADPKPQTWTLLNGRYHCATCVPVMDIKADGSDQPTPGDPTADTVAVKAASPAIIELIYKKAGKIASNEKRTVSADGRMLTVEFTGYPETSKEPVTGKVSLSRTAAPPAGAHAVSGSWRTEKFDTISDNGLTFTIEGTADGLAMSSPTGIMYDAKFDGNDYPLKGDPTIDMVSLKKVSDREVIETDKRGGKIITVSTMTVSADGKTLSMKNEDKEHGTTMTFTATKQ
jgi:hypothetical protein